MGKLGVLLLLILVLLVGFQAWQTNRLTREVQALRREVAAPAPSGRASAEDRAVKAVSERVQKDLADTRKFIEKRLSEVYRPEKDKGK